jgi:hypothetical protein
LAAALEVVVASAGKTTYPSPPAPALQLLLALGLTITAQLRGIAIFKASLWFAALLQIVPLAAATLAMAGVMVGARYLLAIAGAALVLAAIPAMAAMVALLILVVITVPAAVAVEAVAAI